RGLAPSPPTRPGIGADGPPARAEGRRAGAGGCVGGGDGACCAPALDRHPRPAAPARPAPHLRPCPAHPGLGCLPGPVRVVFPHLALTPRPAAPPRALAHPLGAPHRGGVRGGVEPAALADLDRRQSPRLPLKPSPSRGPSGSP